jgi:hypothetical protein
MNTLLTDVVDYIENTSSLVEGLQKVAEERDRKLRDLSGRAVSDEVRDLLVKNANEILKARSLKKKASDADTASCIILDEINRLRKNANEHVLTLTMGRGVQDPAGEVSRTTNKADAALFRTLGLPYVESK